MAARFDRTTFESSNLDEANFEGAWLTDCSFSRCRAQRSNWFNSTLARVRFDVDLRNANFTPALSEAIDFTGSNLWGAVVPLNCALVSANRFDERQIGMFLALLGQAELPTELGLWIEEATPKKAKALLDRILRGATMDDEN
jgi:hypothetical protein